ncbi:MAG: helix-turn-helix transcriptional regulator, partial [Clostridia bacterium]
ISDQALVENVLMSISTMYMTDFDVTQLARIHNISYRHLARIFVNITGYTLGEWTMYTRIYSSMEFLVETSMPIAAIAKQVGFSSESYFSSIFSRTVGIAPTVFRKAQAGGPMVAPALDDMPGVGGPKRNKLYNPFQPHLADTTRIQFITQGHSL